MVFCRERGWKEELDPVEAREGVCNITDILANLTGDGEVSRGSDAYGPMETIAGEWQRRQMSVAVLGTWD